MKGIIKTMTKSFSLLVLGMCIMLVQKRTSSSSSSSASHGIVVNASDEHHDVHVKNKEQHVGDTTTIKNILVLSPPSTFLRGRDPADSTTATVPQQQQYHHHGRSLQQAGGETYVVFDFRYGYKNAACGEWIPEFSFSCLDAHIVVLSATESTPNIVSCEQNGISGIECQFADAYGGGVLSSANVNIQFACVSPSNSQRQTSFTASGTSFRPSDYSTNNQPSCYAGGNVNHLLSLSYYDPQSGMVLPEYSSCQQGQPFPIEVDNQNPLLTCAGMGQCPFDSIGGCETFLGPVSSIITIEDGGQPAETSGGQESVGEVLGSVTATGEAGGQDAVGQPPISFPTSEIEEEGGQAVSSSSGAAGTIDGSDPFSFFSTETSAASTQLDGGIVVITACISVVQAVWMMSV